MNHLEEYQALPEITDEEIIRNRLEVKYYHYEVFIDRDGELKRLVIVNGERRKKRV